MATWHRKRVAELTDTKEGGTRQARGTSVARMWHVCSTGVARTSPAQTFAMDAGCGTVVAQLWHNCGTGGAS